MTEVASILQQARAAHSDYRQKDAAGDKIGARQAVQLAYDLRISAQEADPTMADPAWKLDKVPASELMAFFAKYLLEHEV